MKKKISEKKYEIETKINGNKEEAKKKKKWSAKTENNTTK